MKGVFLIIVWKGLLFCSIGHELIKWTVFHFAIIFTVHKIPHAIITFCNNGLSRSKF